MTGNGKEIARGYYLEAGILHELAGERKIVLNHIAPGKDRRGRVFAAEPGWTGSWT